MKINAEEKFKLDDPSDVEYDFDSFDVGLPPDEGDYPSDDRSPVVQSKDGFLSGVKEASKDPTLFINAARTALPEGYGAAIDTYNDVKSSGLGLYNEITREMRPAVNDLKRLGRRVKSAVSGILPEKLSNSLDKLLEENELRSYEKSERQLQNEEIASTSDEIFALKAKRDEEVQETQATEEMVDRLVETRRHATQTDQLQNIGNLLSQQVGYQDSILVNYQKKSLELDFKKYFILRDHYNLYKANQPETLSILRNMVKNTALPDIIKMRNTELATQMTKEKLIGKIQDKIAPQARDFLDATTKVLGVRVKEKVDEFKEGVAMASMAGDQLEMASENDGMGPSNYEVSGQMAGDTGLRWLGEYIGKKLRAPLAKNQNLAGVGNKLLYGSENYNKIIKQYMQENSFDSKAMQFLQEIVLEAGEIRRESLVGYDQMGKATDPTPFDNLTRKSIVEVIPGWLARLYQVGKSMLLKKWQPLETYDHSSNSFDSVDKVAEKIMEMAASKDSLNVVKERTDDVIKNLDAQNKLSEDGLDALREFLAREAYADKLLNVNDIATGKLGTKAGLSNVDNEALMEATKNKLNLQEERDKDTGEVNYKFSNDNVKGTELLVKMQRDMVALREAIPNVYEVANQFANTGNREALRQTGMTKMINDEDHIDNEFIFKGLNKKDKENVLPNERWNIPTGSDTPLGIASGDIQRQKGEKEDLYRFEGFLDKLESSLGNLQVPDFNDMKVDFEIDAFKDVFEAHSVKSETQGILDAINEIRDYVVNGSLSVNVVEEKVDPDGDTNFDDNEPSSRAKRIDRAINYTKGMFGTGKRLLGRAGGMLKKSIINPFAILGRVPGIKDINFRSFKDDIDAAFIEGVKDPILTKAAMLRGEYVNPVTGEIITEWKDMVDGVKDSRGEWIITAKGVKENLIDHTGKKLSVFKGLLNKGVNFAKDKSMGVFKKLVGMSPLGGVMEVGSWAKDKVSDFLSRPTDLYLHHIDPDNPILTKIGFKNGSYSDKEGNIITKPKDIKGAVYADKGLNILVEAKDVPKLKTRSGRSPFKGLFGRTLDRLGQIKDKALGAGKWLMSGAKSIAKGGAGLLKGAAGILGGGLSAINDTDTVGGITGGGRTLKKIYRLLLQWAAKSGVEIDETEATSESTGGKIKSFFKRLIKPAMKEKADEAVEAASVDDPTLAEKVKAKKERTLGREGNWRTKLAERGKKVADKVKGNVGGKDKDDKKSGGFSSMLFGILGKAIGILGGIGGGIKGMIGKLTTLIGISKAAAMAGGGGGLDPTDLMGDGPDRNTKGGKGKGGWLRRAGRAIWSGAKTVGRVGMAVASRAPGALMAAAPWVIGAGKMAVGALVGIGTAITAIATSPVTIGIAIAAAAAYGGYKLYKHFADKLDPLVKLRMAHYGVPDLDADKCAKIAAFEDQLKDGVLFREGEQPKITTKVTGEMLKGIFNIDGSDQVRLEKFVHWFRDRFKPVFLSHMQVLNTVKKGADIQKADEVVPDKFKVSFSKQTTYTSDPNPYEVESEPFDDGEAMDTGRGLIDEIMEEIVDEFGVDAPITNIPKSALSNARQEVNRLRGGGYTKAKQEGIKNANALNSNQLRAPAANDPQIPVEDPMSTGQTAIYRPKSNRRDEIVKSIFSIADELGVSASILMDMAKKNSGFNPEAEGGLFNTDEETFKRLSEKYKEKYGVKGNLNPKDPYVAIYTAAEDLLNTQNELKAKANGRRVYQEQVYMRHVLGKKSFDKLEGKSDETVIDHVEKPSPYVKPGDTKAMVRERVSSSAEEVVSDRESKRQRDKVNRERIDRAERQTLSRSTFNQERILGQHTETFSSIDKTLLTANKIHMQNGDRLDTIIKLLKGGAANNVSTETKESNEQSNVQSQQPQSVEQNQALVKNRRSV